MSLFGGDKTSVQNTIDNINSTAVASATGSFSFASGKVAEGGTNLQSAYYAPVSLNFAQGDNAIDQQNQTERLANTSISSDGIKGQTLAGIFGLNTTTILIIAIAFVAYKLLGK